METRRGRPRRSEAESLIASAPKTPAKTPAKEGTTTGATTRSRMAAKPKPMSNQAVIGIAMTAATTFLGVAFFAYIKLHAQYFNIPAKFSNISDRLTFTLQWNCFTMLPLLLSFFNVMNLRVSSGAVDPLAGYEDLVQKAKNILQNTVEQTMFNLVNQLVLISWIPADQMFLIPLFAMLFVFGRIAFMIGYTISPRYRTFGFVLTFAPSFFMFASNFLFGFGLRTQIPFLSGGRSTGAPPKVGQAN